MTSCTKMRIIRTSMIRNSREVFCGNIVEIHFAVSKSSLFHIFRIHSEGINVEWGNCSGVVEIVQVALTRRLSVAYSSVISILVKILVQFLYNLENVLCILCIYVLKNETDFALIFTR